MNFESLFLSNLLSRIMEVTLDIILSVIDLLSEWWVILLIIAALCHAIVEFIDEHVIDHLKNSQKSEGEQVGVLTIVSGLFGIIFTFAFAAYAVVTGTVSNILINQTHASMALLAGILETVWMIPYLHAIRRGGAINASPLFQLIPLFSLILGLVVFGEQPLIGHILGGLAIVTGAFVLNCKPGTFKLDRTTVLLMALASLIICVVYFLFKEVVLEENFLATAFWNGIGMAIMSFALWGGYRPYREEFNAFITSSKHKAMFWQTTNEGVNAVGTLLTHLAVAKAPSVMLAASLNAFHPVFTLMIGWVLGKGGSEKHAEALKGGEFSKKAIAVLLLAAGTILVAQT